MLNRRLMLVVMGMAMFGFLGLVGCKNVCEKAADHMKGCMESYCEEAEEGDPICEAMENQSDAEMPECTGEMESASQELLDKTCDELFGGGGE